MAIFGKICVIMENVRYSRLFSSELELFGCSFPRLSSFSMKATLNDEIIGWIAIEDTPLRLIQHRNDDVNVVNYKKAINNRATYYLRKITFSEKFRYNGVLEELFAMICKNMPFPSSIWCKPQIWDREGYVKQIGGFMPPPYDVKRNIVLFSLNI